MKLSSVILLVFVTVFQMNISAQETKPEELKISTRENTGAQENVIDIRKIVERQIQAAVNRRYNKVLNESLKNIIQVESADKKETNRLSGFGSSFLKMIDTRIIVLLAAGIVLVAAIGYRRKRLNGNKEDERLPDLKKRIAMIRNEEPVIIESSGLSEVRKNLRSMPLEGKSYGKAKPDISKRAKELNVSKGEILLAAKLRSYETAGR